MVDVNIGFADRVKIQLALNNVKRVQILSFLVDKTVVNLDEVKKIVKIDNDVLWSHLKVLSKANLIKYEEESLLIYPTKLAIDIIAEMRRLL